MKYTIASSPRREKKLGAGVTRALIFCICAGLAVLPFLTVSPALAATPALRIVQVTGYTIAVEGVGWPHRARISIALHQGAFVRGLELKANRRGSFRVGVTNVNLCSGVIFEAHDLKGHAETARGPALACPIPLNPPVPILKVLRGASTLPDESRLVAVSRPGTTTLRVGDELYLWQPGTRNPLYTPSVDASFLTLIDYGPTPARACIQTACGQGYFWTWIAIHPGDTFLTLSPACRQSKPQCEVPSFEYMVHIVA